MSGCMFRVIILLEGQLSTPVCCCLSSSIVIFPSTLITFPFHSEEKQSHSMMLPPLCFTVDMVCSGCQFSATVIILHVGLKVKFWSHLTRAASCHVLAVSSALLVANYKQDFTS
ncbi:hypothetical protein AMECASPLE_028536 [Ameca splendens]|uniref:Secreted protein n=1 Tax=Ameca splendens TaxID=208324 RepID=A0ABV0XUI5_9TELE